MAISNNDSSKNQVLTMPHVMKSAKIIPDALYLKDDAVIVRDSQRRLRQCIVKDTKFENGRATYQLQDVVTGSLYGDGTYVAERLVSPGDYKTSSSSDPRDPKVKTRSRAPSGKPVVVNTAARATQPRDVPCIYQHTLTTLGCLIRHDGCAPC